MNMPDWETLRIPEGAYTFTVKDMEKRKKTSRSTGKDFVIVSLKLTARSESGEHFTHQESLLPWEDRYRDLLIALGGKSEGNTRISGEDVDPIGKSFTAEIEYEADANDTTKSWPRMKDINPVNGNSSFSTAVSTPDDDDIPF